MSSPFVYRFGNRDLEQEEVVKMTQWSTRKFPFKWNRGWLNFDSLAAAARGKFVSGARVLAAVPSIFEPGSFISNFLY